MNGWDRANSRHLDESLQERAANRRLIKIFEAKIKAKLGEIWGEKETREEAAGTETDGQ